MIFTGFSPNTAFVDVLAAMKQLLLFRTWDTSDHALQATTEVSNMYDNAHTVLFDSGRSALYAGLVALGVRKNDFVAVQAFTCIVVINAIRACGAHPVYVDIDESLNMSVDRLRDALEQVPAMKAIIVQHTFGASANDDLFRLAQEKGVFVIEDCAHAFGRHQKDMAPFGLKGAIGMLSFGTDKAISSVRGGALVTKDNQLYEKISLLQQSGGAMSPTSIARHLAQPIIFWFGKKTYRFGGKFLLWMSRKYKLSCEIITREEKQGSMPTYSPAPLPNPLAYLLLKQIPRATQKNMHRVSMTASYVGHLSKEAQRWMKPGVPYVRVPVWVENPAQALLSAKKHHIILGDWYRVVVAPADVALSATSYVFGSCPQAEYAARHMINLPTHLSVSVKDARHIVQSFSSPVT